MISYKKRKVKVRTLTLCECFLSDLSFTSDILNCRRAGHTSDRYYHLVGYSGMCMCFVSFHYLLTFQFRPLGPA